MVEVKIYVIFYASAVSLAAHSSGGLQLSCGTYVAGRLTTCNQRDRLTGYDPVRATRSVEKNTLEVSLYN